MNRSVGKWLAPPAPRRDWRLKLIEATRGNQSLMGCLVLAAIGKEPSNPPFFRGKARITNQNEVLCDFVGKDRIYHSMARISDDEDLVQNLVRLTVHCDLTDDERVEFLARVNAWIEHDDREMGRIRRVMLT